MGKSHYRVTVEDAFEAHEDALEAFGGRSGVLNLDRIESGVARPYHGYHRSISRKAAALLEGVGNGHGFLDGNKRTAVILTNLLIEASGYTLSLQPGESLEDLMVEVASSNIGGDDLWRWFKERLVKAM